MNHKKGTYAICNIDTFLLNDIFFSKVGPGIWLSVTRCWLLQEKKKKDHKNVLPFNIALFAVFARVFDSQYEFVSFSVSVHTRVTITIKKMC